MNVVKIVSLMLASAIAFSIVSALPIMVLWNWLMPSIFGLCSISFLQALGIVLLFRLLLGDYKVQKE